MKRAQVYLGEEEYEALRTAAFKRHESISNVVREWVQEHLLKNGKHQKRYAAGLLEMAGILHETTPDVSERHDDYLWGDET
jgi:hypothetical protein